MGSGARAARESGSKSHPSAGDEIALTTEAPAGILRAKPPAKRGIWRVQQFEWRTKVGDKSTDGCTPLVMQRTKMMQKKLWRSAQVCLILAVLILVGMGQGCQNPAPADPESDAQTDAALQFSDTLHPADATAKDAGSETSADATQTPDAANAGDATDAGNCPGASGCACLDNANCANTYCIDDPASTTGKACAHLCVDSCANGYKCSAMSGVLAIWFRCASPLLSICVNRAARPPIVKALAARALAALTTALRATFAARHA